MKTRESFVSNSSSSSFILALPKELNGKSKITIEVDLDKYVDNGGDVSGKITNAKQLKEYFEERYGVDDYDDPQEDYYKKEYDKCIAALQEGKTIYCGSFSDEDEEEEAFLCNTDLHGLLDKTIDVIEGDGNY